MRQRKTKGPKDAAKKKGEPRRRIQKRKLRFTYQEAKEYETIEDDISELEDKISCLEASMAQNAADFVKLGELSKEKDALDETLLEKMERWEYLSQLAQRIKAGETEDVIVEN